MSALSESPVPDQHFYADSDSNVGRLQRWTYGSCLIVGGLMGWLGSGAVRWAGPVAMLLVCVAVWFLARRLMRPGQPVVTLTQTHLESPLLKKDGGRIAWEALADVDIRYFQKSASLWLTLRGGDASRNFWSGLQPNQRVLPMTMFNQSQHIQLFDLIRSRLPKERAPGAMDEWEEEVAFHKRMKALAPIPWLTWGLIGLNVLLWGLTDFAQFGLKPATADQLLLWGGNAASEVQRGEWWRLLTATFLHGGLVHLAMNMMGLYAAGVMVERIYGRWLYALIYLGTGLCGSALSLHFAAQSSVSVGASGAVFGVTGALLVAMLQHKDKLPSTFGRETITGLSFFILYALVQGFAKEGVDNAAHVGGLVGGALLAWVLPERFDLALYRKTWRLGALKALALACLLVGGLSVTAPEAKVDQMGRLQANRDFLVAAQAFDQAMSVLRQEAEDIKSGRMSLRESDDRSRSVHAPAFRRVSALFDQVKMSEDNPRYRMYRDLKRMSELLVESLSMESVFPEGQDEPMPVDPLRALQINQELSQLVQRLNAKDEKGQ